MDQDCWWCEVVQFWIDVEPAGFHGELNKRKTQVKDDFKYFVLSNWKDRSVNELR